MSKITFTCTTCGKNKERTLVRKAGAHSIWRVHDIDRLVDGNKCGLCTRKNLRAYEKTVRGFVARLYRNMKSRVEGVQKKCSHLYIGKELLPKKEFYEWALENKEMLRLFEAWEKEGFPRRLTPSVDRINSERGYTLDNMEWVTLSENSRRGSINQLKTNKGYFGAQEKYRPK